LSVSEEIARASGAGLMVRVACCELAPRVAVITALVVAVTDCVVIAKAVVVLPAGMDTRVGMPAEMLFVESVTSAPPAGAGPVRVTVP
jgi:hypothetical protein